MIRLLSQENDMNKLLGKSTTTQSQIEQKKEFNPYKDLFPPEINDIVISCLCNPNAASGSESSMDDKRIKDIMPMIRDHEIAIKFLQGKGKGFAKRIALISRDKEMLQKLVLSKIVDIVKTISCVFKEDYPGQKIENEKAHRSELDKILKEGKIIGWRRHLPIYKSLDFKEQCQKLALLSRCNLYDADREQFEDLILAGVRYNQCYGATPIHEAASHGLDHIVDMLIAEGYSPNLQDNTLAKWTPIFYASNEKTLQLLVSKGADVNVVKDKKNLFDHYIYGPMHIPIVKICLYGGVISSKRCSKYPEKNDPYRYPPIKNNPQIKAAIALRDKVLVKLVSSEIKESTAYPRVLAAIIASYADGDDYISTANNVFEKAISFLFRDETAQKQLWRTIGKQCVAIEMNTL